MTTSVLVTPQQKTKSFFTVAHFKKIKRATAPGVPGRSWGLRHAAAAHAAPFYMLIHRDKPRGPAMTRPVGVADLPSSAGELGITLSKLPDVLGHLLGPAR